MWFGHFATLFDFCWLALNTIAIVYNAWKLSVKTTKRSVCDGFTSDASKKNETKSNRNQPELNWTGLNKTKLN